MDGYSGLSANIVNYVTRTKSIVLLNDATRKGMFVNDTYIKEKQPKSISMLSDHEQGNLIEFVYLENI